MISDFERIDKKAQLEKELKEYKGSDRVVLAEDKLKELEEENKNIPKFALMTGISSLDECTTGFRKGQLIVVSGPPKSGKTSLCATLTKKLIEYKCLWFSYELSYEEVFENFPMEILDFTIPNQMQSGNLSWVEKRIIESILKFQTKIVFIDHLDFLSDPEILTSLKGVGLNNSNYVGGIIQRLKDIARDNNLVIFLMCHINKLKWTTNNLPDSEQIADSRKVVDLADIVMMIIRKRAKKGSDTIYEGNKAIVGVIENRKTGKTKKWLMGLIDKEFKEITDNYQEEDAFSNFNV